jgi:outer membrane autotransporter protein
MGGGYYPIPTPPSRPNGTTNPAQNSIWTEGFGSMISQSKRDGVQGYDANIIGFSFGADIFASPVSTVGLAVAYGKTSSEGTVDSTSSSTSTSTSNFESNITSYQISAYGTRNFGRAYIDSIASFSKNEYDSKRTLFDGSIAKRDSTGNQISFKASTGYAFEAGKESFITPFASIQYSKLSQGDYTETGSNANLIVKPGEINVLKSGLGLKFSTGAKANNAGQNFHMFAGWYHDFAAESVEITSSFASAPTESFVTKGASVPADSVRGGAGIDLISKGGTSLSLDYVVEAKAQFIAHTAVAKVRFAF